MFESIEEVFESHGVIIREWRIPDDKKFGGSKHRTDGPAVSWSDGREEWWFKNRRHREDGPALIHRGGALEWWVNGKCHRLDGPAVLWPEGQSSWYINNWYVDHKIREWAVELGIDLNNLSEYDKNMIAIVWTDYGK